MPELPEVETIVRSLQKQVISQKILKIEVNLPKIIKSHQEEFVSLTEGASIQDVSRRGKIILISLSTGVTILIHLKLTGQLIYSSSKKPITTQTHLIFNLSSGDQLRYLDLRQFGYFLLEKSDRLSLLKELAILGPEALEISLADFKKVSKKRGRIKVLLMNQSILAGIGNMYADEILHQAKIHPLCLACVLSEDQIERLYQATREILTKAIAYKGSSVDTYINTNGEEGSYQRFHQVYQREGKQCFSCSSKIIRLKINSRSSHFCPNCQKREPEN